MPKALKILDFDLENRPLSYLGSDYTTGDVTAIAWAWVGREEEVSVAWQTKKDVSRINMLQAFRVAYEQADMVTGHFIRGYDLPVLNGAYMEIGMPPLEDKLSSDTKNDLRKRKYISASQENLGAMLGLVAPKIQMNTPKWREANRLTDEGILLTIERVTGDVRQHMQLRAKLIELGWLGPPKVWRSAAAGTGAYTP